MDKDKPQEPQQLPNVSSGDLHSIWQQIKFPLRWLFYHADKIDVVVTIGRLMLMPAFVTTAIIVAASSPLIHLWMQIHAPAQEESLDNSHVPPIDLESSPQHDASELHQPKPIYEPSVLSGPDTERSEPRSKRLK